MIASKQRLKKVANFYNAQSRQRYWDEQDTELTYVPPPAKDPITALFKRPIEEYCRDGHCVTEEVTVFDGKRVLLMEIYKFDVGQRVVLIDVQGFMHWVVPSLNLEASRGALYTMMLKPTNKYAGGYKPELNLYEEAPAIPETPVAHQKQTYIFEH